MNLEV
jgi:hypothetical protein